MKTILLISPYWKEEHRWMVSSVKLSELWQRLGYRVVVSCMGPQTRVRKESETLTIYEKKDFFLPDPWNYGIAPGFTTMVFTVIKRERPDIIVCNKLLFWTSLAVVPLRFRGRRVIQLTDALVGITWWPRGFFPKVCAVLYAWTLGWLILLCAWKVVFFHPQTSDLLKRLHLEKKSRVIPTGIDVGRYQVTKSQSHPSTELISMPSSRCRGRAGSVTVTYVGRLESVKGVDDFLAAVKPLKEQEPTLNIQVVGWFKEHHPLVEEYRDTVTFMGLRNDVPNILAATDIFVLPSYSEGLSNALMEAMASRCACVATDVGGNRFLIQNGVSGFLFTPGDREALRSHVRRLLEDSAKRRALGIAARKRIEEHFDWSVVGEKYRALFDEA